MSEGVFAFYRNHAQNLLCNSARNGISPPLEIALSDALIVERCISVNQMSNGKRCIVYSRMQPFLKSPVETA